MKAIEQRRRMAGQGGFTLIELLVVIAILAVLAGVVVFAVGGITDTSKDSACKIDKRTLATAVQAYWANDPNHAWPADQAALVAGGFLDSQSVSYNFTPPTPPAKVVTYTAIANNPNGCA